MPASRGNLEQFSRLVVDGLRPDGLSVLKVITDFHEAFIPQWDRYCIQAIPDSESTVFKRDSSKSLIGFPSAPGDSRVKKDEGSLAADHGGHQQCRRKSTRSYGLACESFH